MPIRREHLELLKPYLEGDTFTHRNADGQREWNMKCPIHGDSRRSASLNLDKAEWWCFTCQNGGRVASLIRQHAEWLPPGAQNGNGKTHTDRKAQDLPSAASIKMFHEDLKSSPGALAYLTERRGLTIDTIERFCVGYDKYHARYMIPVYDDKHQLMNVRIYDPSPKNDQRKIWGITGHNTPRLYPWVSLESDRIIICEGEWDVMVLQQNGFSAITRTGTADTWHASWSPYFRGKLVFLCHDMDEKGQLANAKISRELVHHADDVRIVQLPYDIMDKHGKDVTDFFFEYERGDFERLLVDARSVKEPKQESDVPEISVVESFNSINVGKAVGMSITVKGKRGPGYSVPRVAKLMCTKDAGVKCKHCPMYATPAGEDQMQIEPSDPVVLELMDSTQAQITDIVRRAYGAVKCTKLRIDAEGHQAVEILFARPDLDAVTEHGTAGDFQNIKVTSVGRHDTHPNTTVKVVGALHPNPRSQANEFQAWEVEKQITSIDNFELTPEGLKLMQKFQCTAKQSPLAKLADISRDMSAHVTRIVGRPEMHALIDLVYHSVVSYKFGGDLITRGWLDALILGDTQQGKSETAKRLARHYQAGEVVNCEVASFAGIFGGLQQFGTGKEWAVTWGAIPINDRRLVILEEASGLSPDEISQTSEFRASGIAKITKVVQEVTHARTRLLWLSNPREARMSDFTYGVQAIRPLVGNNEDIARFDMAMSVSLGEVDPAAMNRQLPAGELAYTSEACATLVRWAWTRSPDQVKWAPGAEEIVYELALDMGSRYIEDPPLVQASNIREKITRVAVALAARVFSSEDGESLIVKKEHVRDAVAFMDRLYNMPGFGYAERSTEALDDVKEAAQKREEIIQYLGNQPGLAKFLKNNSRFRRQDLEEILNLDRGFANSIINTLWEARMVRKDGQDIRVEASLHSILREKKL